MPTTPLGFSNNRPLQVMVAWLVGLWLLLAIAPRYRQDWALENIMVVAYAIALTVTFSRFQFSNRAYFLFTIFMTLHLIGAHYTYAETPLGYWMQEWFTLRRNHYDRLVHFGFGLLIAYPIRELLVRVIHVKVSWASTLAVMLILSMGAVFELFEMWAALIVSPELGNAYLGTQGDIWDAQQDMGLASTGAIVAMLIRRLRAH